MEISSNFSVLTNIESFQDKNNFTDSSLLKQMQRPHFTSRCRLSPNEHFGLEKKGTTRLN